MENYTLRHVALKNSDIWRFNPWRSKVMHTISTSSRQVFKYDDFVIFLGVWIIIVFMILCEGEEVNEIYSQRWCWQSHYEVQILYPRAPKLGSWIWFWIRLQYTTNLEVYTWWMSSFQDLGLFSTQTSANGSTLQYMHVFVHVEVYVEPRRCSRV